VVDVTPFGSLSVLACSALKRKYRTRLGVDADGVALVYLQSAPDVLLARLIQRPNHFMKEEMLASQLADLEPPCADEGITVDNDRPLDKVVESIVSRLS
jgi:gluconokinase